MKIFLTLIITALIAVSATWFVMRDHGLGAQTSASSTRKVIFYQSAMHPWIKSDKPGRCTICGMELTPVYEGEKGLDEFAGGNMVTLSQNQIQVLHVQTAPAKIRPLQRSLRVSGTVEENSMRHRVLAAYVDGRIDQLHVNYIGAEVAQGQPLIDVYSPTLLQAEREYRQMTGELKKNTGLRLRQMGLTDAQIEAVETKPADSLTSLILSPMNGTVVTQSVFEGQYVTAGQQLLEIADFSTMWFMFRVYEQDMPWIKTGLDVRVSTPSLPDQSVIGQITFIDPNFDETTRSTKVRVELANPLVNGKRAWLSRLYADGAVALDAPSVLTVPKSAVIETGAEAVVYVDQSGGAYAHTTVKLGRRGDHMVEILAGLKEGDAVVTNGNLLIDGQAEMNRAFMVAPEDNGKGVDSGAFNEAQNKAVGDFLKLADAMASALGRDDLAAFNKVADRSMTVTGTMVDLLKPEVKDLEALEKARHLHGFEDIQSARIAFHAFTVAATTVMQPLRKNKKIEDFQIYECGMVNQAIPNAPKNGRWIQTGGRPMSNPFFGKEMQDCGMEIKP